MKCNYQGDYFLVIDDNDKYIEEYKKIYPNNLLIFKKSDYIKGSMNNEIQKSPYYARNFCFDYCKEHYKYFLMLDDDITNFLYIVEDVERNKLSKMRIPDINKTFKVMMNYLDKTSIDCLAFSNDGGNFGGIDGRYKNGCSRIVNQAMMFRSSTSARFIGAYNEDLNICLNDSNLMMELYILAVSSPSRGGNKAIGYSDNFFIENFYSKIYKPGKVKLTMNKNCQVIVKKFVKRLMPKIISQRYMKPSAYTL